MNELHKRLSEAAEEMTGTDYTDLRRRVDAKSRRLRSRRAVLGSLAALVVLAGVVTGVWLLPRPHALPGPAASDEPSDAVTPSSLSDKLPTPAGVIPGTLIYLRRAGGTLAVVTVTDGEAPQTRSFGPDLPDQHVVSVSPDGTRIAMIISPDPGNVKPGDLVVIEPGGARRTLATDVSWGGGLWPYWTPDGKQLLVKKGVWLYVEVATGKTSAGPPVDGEYFAWAPGGAYRAYRELDGRVAVTDANWKVVRHTATRNLQGCPAPAGLGCCPAPKDVGCSSVQAVSPDGWYVAVGITNTDPNHVTRTAAVLDSRAGRPIPIQSVGPGEMSKVIMSKDRGILVEKVTADGHYTLYLVAYNDPITAIVAETARPGDLVGYRD